MSSRRNFGARNVVPGTLPIPDTNLRVRNAEREAIFAKAKEPLPHGDAARAAAIATKFRDLDTMISDIATREQMSREEILSLVKNQSSFTLLHAAAESGRDEIIDYLFRPDMFVDKSTMRMALLMSRNTTLDRPIHIAARNDCVAFIQALVSRGVSIDMTGAFKYTPLHFAVLARHGQLVVDIVEMGAELNLQSMSGQTPLHLAVQNNDIEAVKYLLDKGADATIRNAGDLTPGVVARGHEDKTMHLLFIELMFFCRNRGLGVIINSSGAGFTPLHFAVQAVDRQLVTDLVDMGANTNVQNMGGETPLHLAVHKGDVETVKYLLDHGADATAEVHEIFVARGLPC
ncbi:hypothetical protein PG993_009095 [Apiospora rasikravindrae]|uniref:Uncharacterized protein n=1 Tax=Apiospora rasikravindrae TaxID=990691 RepID=A0ABR1SK67_9PEZI